MDEIDIQMILQDLQHCILDFAPEELDMYELAMLKKRIIEFTRRELEKND